MSAIMKLKRVSDYYMTHDEQYKIYRDKQSEFWHWGVRIGTSPSYQAIDGNDYRTRKDCLYAVKDYDKEQQLEEKLWGE